ncbi:MAG TPA: hypothetical protein VG944_08590 [Fimbriimonas sp.]|nr:hypothetical protein [Fimbriimonas sp.]
MFGCHFAFLDVSDNMVAVFTMAIAFMVPIVAVLTKHQQKMALILKQGSSDHHVDKLAADVEQLRSMVAQQTILLDNLAQSQKQLALSLQQAPTSERINV